MKLARFSLLILGPLLLQMTLQAVTPGGLSVAMSSDGSQLLVAGETRTFLDVDPSSLEVTRRVWNGYSITDLAFSSDGKTVAAMTAGNGSVVVLFDAVTLSEKTQVKDCEPNTFVQSANLFAGIKHNRRADEALCVYSLKDGSLVKEIPIQPKMAVAVVALSLDGKQAAVLYEGKKDEETEPKSTVDSALRDLERAIARQKSDGRTSLVEFYDVESGTLSSSASLFYSSNAMSMGNLVDGNLIVVNYTNENATITPEGEVEMFQLANPFNYGMGVTSDLSLILAGGMVNLSVTPMQTLKSQETMVSNKLPSWPEYFKDFCGGADGLCYGTTDGFRLFAIGRDGTIQKVVPIY